MANGTYNLIDYSGSFSGNAASVTVSGLSSGTVRQAFAAVASSGTLSLQASGAPGNLVWAGTPVNTWDTTSMNWKNSGTADKFYTNDNVTFDDTASTGTVVLNTSVQPSSVIFNNNVLNYTLSGSGGISGPTGLTKSGSGLLTMTNYNTYSGNTIVSGGTLEFLAASWLRHTRS